MIMSAVKKRLELKCPECGRLMEEITVKYRGFPVRAWKCPKDKEEILDPLDYDIAVLLYKIKIKPEKVKTGKISGAPYIRFPLEFKSLIPFGSEILITVKDENELILKIPKHEHNQCL